MGEKEEKEGKKVFPGVRRRRLDQQLLQQESRTIGEEVGKNYCLSVASLHCVCCAGEGEPCLLLCFEWEGKGGDWGRLFSSPQKRRKRGAKKSRTIRFFLTVFDHRHRYTTLYEALPRDTTPACSVYIHSVKGCVEE